MSVSSDFGLEPSLALADGQLPAAGCPLCGCTGIHACTGAPIVWTPADVNRFHSVLNEIFGIAPPGPAHEPLKSAGPPSGTP